MPVLALGPLWVSFMIEPQPPAVAFSGLVALVSPVSSKKNVLNFEPGWKRPFSGRLNGVALAALARSIATNGALPSTAVSWIVTHFVVERVAVGVQFELVGAVQRFLARERDRFAFAAFSTCSACSLPCWRSPGCAGT